MRPALAHIDTWIFDLDNTLYPASMNIFAQIDARMTQFIAELLDCSKETAFALQKRWFIDHGMTLAGLMADHGVDPHVFLDYAHDIELHALEADAVLADTIVALPGRKLVFTNGDAPYARRVLARRGLAECFEGICDIHATGYRPKPQEAAYRHLVDAHGIDPKRALFVEDMARNLKPAKAIGMTTVWVANGSEQSPDADRDHIDYVTPDIGQWLADILKEPA